MTSKKDDYKYVYDPKQFKIKPSLEDNWIYDGEPQIILPEVPKIEELSLKDQAKVIFTNNLSN